MLIPTSAIADWRDLQGRVAMIFSEMGYYTETPRHVELAGRGKKQVDVYIKDEQVLVQPRQAGRRPLDAHGHAGLWRQ
jgi:hypothetical protein